MNRAASSRGSTVSKSPLGRNRTLPTKAIGSNLAATIHKEPRPLPSEAKKIVVTQFVNWIYLRLYSVVVNAVNDSPGKDLTQEGGLDCEREMLLRRSRRS